MELTRTSSLFISKCHQYSQYLYTSKSLRHKYDIMQSPLWLNPKKTWLQEDNITNVHCTMQKHCLPSKRFPVQNCSKPYSTVVQSLCQEIFHILIPWRDLHNNNKSISEASCAYTLPVSSLTALLYLVASHLLSEHYIIHIKETLRLWPYYVLITWTYTFTYGKAG